MFKHPRPILIVDDDVELVTLLVDYLQLEGFAPVAAHNGTEALELLSRQEFEIVVLDVMMPGMSGVEVLKRIREKSQLPVLMLTAKGDPVDRIIGLELGADDFVVKPFDMKEISARVKAVLRRYTAHEDQSDDGVIKFDNIEISLPKYELKLKGKPVEIPPKELQLLYFLASNFNRVFTRDQLLDKVWGFDYLGDSRTVDVHIKRLREKIKDHAAWRLATVWGIGYKFEVK